MPNVRKGQTDVALSREAFERRLRERFHDPAFDRIGDHVDRVVDVAWDSYHEYRKSPRTRKAGPGFADPEYELPIEWRSRPRRETPRARWWRRWRCPGAAPSPSLAGASKILVRSDSAEHQPPSRCTGRRPDAGAGESKKRRIEVFLGYVPN
jgi:hypothetical protein